MPNIDRRTRRIDVPAAVGGGGGLIGDGGAAEPTAPAAAQSPPPTNLTITGSFVAASAIAPLVTVNVSWRAPEGNFEPEQYRVQWAFDSAFTTPTTRATPRGQTTATLDGIPAWNGQGTQPTVYVRVAAIVRGQPSAWSNTASELLLSDLTPPAAPTNLTFAWDGVTGDLTIRWDNPTSANLRDVRVRLYTAPAGTLLLDDASTVGRFVLPLSRNRQLSGGPRTSLYVVLTARSTSGVPSATDLTGTATISAPATPGSAAHSWSAAPTTAAADWRITWTASTGAREYVLTIDGQDRIVTDLAYVYTFAQNGTEHAGTPDPVLSYSLVARNALGQSSSAASGTATNSAPPATTISALGVFSTIALTITPSTAQDLRDYRIRIYKDTVLQSGETFFTTELSPIYTVKAGSGSYTFDVTVFDLFGQSSTASAQTSAAVATDVREFIASLREGANYTRLIGGTVPAGTKTAWSDGNTTSGGANVTADPNWQWIEVARDYNDRYRTMTIGRFAMASGALSWYIAMSTDGTTWRYFTAPFTSLTGRILMTEQGSEAAARTAGANIVTDATTNTRWELPEIVEARFIRLWMLKSDVTWTLREFYPRRLVQSDDIEAEAITTANLAAAAVVADTIAAGAVTATKISVSQLSAITADLGTITAGTVTGATIRTAASGQRVELTSANGLRGINSGGITQVQISASDGTLTAGGGAVVLDADGLRISTGSLFDYTRGRIRWGSGTPFIGYSNNSPITFTLGGVGGDLEFRQVGASNQGFRLRAGTQTIIEHPVEVAAGPTFDETLTRITTRLVVSNGLIVGLRPATLPTLGQIYAVIETATTNAVVLHSTLAARSSGSVANGFGSQLRFELETSTANEVTAHAVNVSWVNATHASRASRAQWFAYDAANAREGLRIEATGSAPAIGFLGAAAVARQTVGAAATDATSTQTLANNLRTALINLGLCAA